MLTLAKKEKCDTFSMIVLILMYLDLGTGKIAVAKINLPQLLFHHLILLASGFPTKQF